MSTTTPAPHHYRIDGDDIVKIVTVIAIALVVAVIFITSATRAPQETTRECIDKAKPEFVHLCVQPPATPTANVTPGYAP